MLPREGPERVAIEDVTPQVDGGTFPAKRVVGDAVDVEADIFTDGTSAIVSVLRWRPVGSRKWDESPMAPIGNDRWRGTFRVDEMGRYRFTLRAWVDPAVRTVEARRVVHAAFPPVENPHKAGGRFGAFPYQETVPRQQFGEERL